MSDQVRIIPMTDHYAAMFGDDLVAVVIKTADNNWQVRTIRGRVPEPSSYIPLDMALKCAAQWTEPRSP